MATAFGKTVMTALTADVILSAFDSFKSDVEFQGYDPAEFWEILVKKAQEKSINEATMAKDMSFIVTWGSVRGSNMAKTNAASKTSDAGKAKIAQIITTYDIISGAPQKKEEITINRILGVFPHLIAAILSSGKGRVVGTIPFSMQAHPFLCFPSGCALIPTDDSTLMNAWREWAYNFDYVVNRATGKYSKSNVDTYSDIIWKSSYYSDTRRATVVTACLGRFNTARSPPANSPGTIPADYMATGTRPPQPNAPYMRGGTFAAPPPSGGFGFRSDNNNTYTGTAPSYYVVVNNIGDQHTIQAKEIQAYIAKGWKIIGSM